MARHLNWFVSQVVDKLVRLTPWAPNSGWWRRPEIWWWCWCSFSGTGAIGSVCPRSCRPDSRARPLPHNPSTHSNCSRLWEEEEEEAGSFSLFTHQTKATCIKDSYQTRTKQLTQASYNFIFNIDSYLYMLSQNLNLALRSCICLTKRDLIKGPGVTLVLLYEETGHP